MHRWANTSWSWRCLNPGDIFTRNFGTHDHRTLIREISVHSEFIHPFMLTVFPITLTFVHYQYDNVPCHKASIVKKLFQENHGEGSMLQPPNSPNMNPVNTCGSSYRSRFMLHHHHHHKNVWDLVDTLLTDKIPQDIYRHLIASLSSHCLVGILLDR